jgi:hypothetical protein
VVLRGGPRIRRNYFPSHETVAVVRAVAADNRVAVILVMLNSYGLSGSRAQFSINPISLKNQVNGGSEKALGRETERTCRCSMPRPGHFARDKAPSVTALWTPVRVVSQAFAKNVSNPGAVS